MKTKRREREKEKKKKLIRTVPLTSHTEGKQKTKKQRRKGITTK